MMKPAMMAVMSPSAGPRDSYDANNKTGNRVLHETLFCVAAERFEEFRTEDVLE